MTTEQKEAFILQKIMEMPLDKWKMGFDADNCMEYFTTYLSTGQVVNVSYDNIHRLSIDMINQCSIIINVEPLLFKLSKHFRKISDSSYKDGRYNEQLDKFIKSFPNP